MRPTHARPAPDKAKPVFQTKTLRGMLEELNLTMTHREIAEQLGVTQGWVWEHVNGLRTGVQHRVLAKVARGLGMEAVDLARLVRDSEPVTK